MKRLTLIITLIVVFIVAAVPVAADDHDAFKSPLPTMLPPDAHHYNAPIMPDTWRHLRVVPLTAAEWESLSR